MEEDTTTAPRKGAVHFFAQKAVTVSIHSGLLLYIGYAPSLLA